MSIIRPRFSLSARALRYAAAPRAAIGTASVARQSAIPIAAISSSSRRFNSSDAAPIASSSAQPFVEAIESAPLVSAPYSIARTASGELPVYSKLRRGNMWKTVIRGVKGDVPALQAELNELFAQGHIDPLTPAPVVTLRPTNRHLEVRGRWVEQVKNWLEERGF